MTSEWRLWKGLLERNDGAHVCSLIYNVAMWLACSRFYVGHGISGKKRPACIKRRETLEQVTMRPVEKLWDKNNTFLKKLRRPNLVASVMSNIGHSY